MKVRILRPARNAMQSGNGKKDLWKILFPQKPGFADPLMGWSGQLDTQQELSLTFDSQEEAIAYATRNGLEYTVEAPQQKKVTPKSYASNFAFRPVA